MKRAQKLSVIKKPPPLGLAGFICPPLLLETAQASEPQRWGGGLIGNRIQVRQRATAQLIREGILGQVRVKLDTLPSMQRRAIHLNGNVSRDHQVNSSRLTWTWVWLLTLNGGQGPDNGFRTLMVISSTLACFHSSPPPAPPSIPPSSLPPSNDNWGGVKWSNSTEIFGGEDTWQMHRDKHDAGVTQREQLRGRGQEWQCCFLCDVCQYYL